MATREERERAVVREALSVAVGRLRCRAYGIAAAEISTIGGEADENSIIRAVNRTHPIDTPPVDAGVREWAKKAIRIALSFDFEDDEHYSENEVHAVLERVGPPPSSETSEEHDERSREEGRAEAGREKAEHIERVGGHSPLAAERVAGLASACGVCARECEAIGEPYSCTHVHATAPDSVRVTTTLSSGAVAARWAELAAAAAPTHGLTVPKSARLKPATSEMTPRDHQWRIAMLARAEPDLPVPSVIFQASLSDREIAATPEQPIGVVERMRARLAHWTTRAETARDNPAAHETAQEQAIGWLGALHVLSADLDRIAREHASTPDLVRGWSEAQVREVARQAWARGAVVSGQMSPEGTSRPDDVQLREWLNEGDDSWIAKRNPGMTASDAITAAREGGATDTQHGTVRR